MWASYVLRHHVHLAATHLYSLRQHVCKLPLFKLAFIRFLQAVPHGTFYLGKSPFLGWLPGIDLVVDGLLWYSHYWPLFLLELLLEGVSAFSVSLLEMGKGLEPVSTRWVFVALELLDLLFPNNSLLAKWGKGWLTIYLPVCFIFPHSDFIALNL